MIHLFHGSTYKFDKIDLSKSMDIGFHCGNAQQAMTRLEWYDKSNSFIYQINIDEVKQNEMVEVDDVFNHLYSNSYEALYEQLSNRLEWFSKECEKKNYYDYVSIRECLLNHGIKYILYNNWFEGEGCSYILLTTDYRLNRIPYDLFNYFYNNMFGNATNT